MNKFIAKSLRAQLFCAVLISLFAGGVIFFASFFLGNALLDKTVYGNTFSRKMEDRRFEDLQEYVTSENVTEDNISLIDIWCRRGEKVYLTVYEDGALIYESPISGKLKNETVNRSFVLEAESADNEYALILSDGTEVRSFLYYFPGNVFYFWMVIVSIVLAFIAFSLCLLTLINRKVSYIRQLQAELDILSGGQLEYAVTVNGKDELAVLASGIDEMRRSIISYQESEGQIRSANSELITAMSHDLRTPLTSLLAYLEIIERKKYTDEEQMYSLIHKSIGQTMRIKRMADKLFEYFTVYATDFENTDMETVDADEFFSQMLGDYAYSLENSGMSIEADVLPLEGSVRVNAELLQRAFDNLYSNILKYADRERAVGITCRRDASFVLIGISNGIASNRDAVESTNIGLNTCKRIIEFHKGTFETAEENNVFSVKILLPVTV